MSGMIIKPVAKKIVPSKNRDANFLGFEMVCDFGNLFHHILSIMLGTFHVKTTSR